MTMPAQDSWSYGGNIMPYLADGVTPDPAYSPLDEVRFLIKDTDTTVRLLGDNEILYTIQQWLGVYTAASNTWNGAYDHPLMAAHACALRLSAAFAGVTSIAADGVTVDVGDLQERYLALATALQEEYEHLQETGGDVDYSNVIWNEQWDYTIQPTWAGIGMHDNPEAGQQDFGGLYGGPFQARDVDSEDQAEFESSP